MGSNSLVLLPAGFDITRNFGVYSSSGVTHYAGTDIDIPATMNLNVKSLTLADHVNCQGTLSAVDNTILNVNNGLFISNNGSVGPAFGVYVTANDAASGMSSGSLAAINEYIGNSGTGVFAPHGGQQHD